jgi:hypothetical protein
VPREIDSFDVAARLAELLDAALADDWTEDEPALAVLWQASADPDDLRIAVKRAERSVERELAPLDDGGAYLGVAHSVVTRLVPPGVPGSPDGRPVRLTVASDYGADCGVVRHDDGTTERFAAGDLGIATLLRCLLCLEPAT